MGQYQTFRGFLIVQIIALVDQESLRFIRANSESEIPQSCPTLYDPMDCSLSGSSVPGIFQARVLEWIAIPSPGDLPDPGIEPRSPSLQADTLPSDPPGKRRAIPQC